MKPDLRSPEAAQYRRLYKTARWAATRARQLERQPLCQHCRAKGIITEATVCHHVDKQAKRIAFFAGPFMSLCAPCHDGPVQQEEVRGFNTEIGVDGWPIDQRHPASTR